IQPYAQYQYKQIRFNVTSGALGIKIPEGEFVDIADDVTIRLGAVNAATRYAEDIFLEQRRDNGSKIIITATRGAISTTPEITQLRLELEKGRRIFIDAPANAVNALDFSQFDIEIELPAIGVFRERGDDEREATFGEIREFLKTNAPQSTENWDKFRAAFHWRLIHPLTFLVMPILAVATGVTGRRRASNLKPILGVAILIVYHELLEEWGQVVAGDGVLSPYVSMWGVLAAFLGVSVLLYRGSIDQAHAAKVMSRRAQPPVRVFETPPNPAFSPRKRERAQ
ncbi:MAG: LptF/LptG family permease, partial [Pseudomonadota bacterium]